MARSDRTNKIILGQLDGVPALINAARRLRDAGFRDFDCHAPFPVHGLNDAMGLKRSSLGYIVGTFAALGLSGMFLTAYWMSAVDYPLIISGKPFNSYQAYTPVVFAIAVLSAAFASFIGMLALNRLPRYHHPAFFSKAFEKVADDGFFVSVSSSDPKFDSIKTPALLESIGCRNLEVLEG